MYAGMCKVLDTEAENNVIRKLQQLLDKRKWKHTTKKESNLNFTESNFLNICKINVQNVTHVLADNDFV